MTPERGRASAALGEGLSQGGKLASVYAIVLQRFSDDPERTAKD